MKKIKNRLLSREQQAEQWKSYFILVELLKSEGRSFSRTNINWYREKYPEMRRQIDEALKAREKLISNMEGFVVLTAQKYARPDNPVEDLKQIGREAVIYALSKFNPDKNTKFSSYAAMWVRSKIAEAVKKSPIIPVPAYSGQKQFTFVSEASFPSDDFVSIYDRIVGDSSGGILDDVLEIITEQEREILEKSYQSSLGLDLWGVKSQSQMIVKRIKEALA